MHHAEACETVAAKTRDKIVLIDQKIVELERMRTVLGQLVASCRARESTGDCPILETLEEGAER